MIFNCSFTLFLEADFQSVPEIECTGRVANQFALEILCHYFLRLEF